MYSFIIIFCCFFVNCSNNKDDENNNEEKINLSDNVISKQKKEEVPFVTFIIPSVGRSRLSKAIESLKNQTDSSWEAIVVFDRVGNPYPEIEKEEKVSVYKIDLETRLKYIYPKINFSSITNDHRSYLNKRAGPVRNFAFDKIKTPWVAFLDDDDQLVPQYVEFLKEEVKRFPTVECVIFRMKYADHRNFFLPRDNTDNFYLDSVGISFAISKNIINDGFRFLSVNAEDYYLLDEIRSAGKHMIISSYLTYFVRGDVDTSLNNLKIGNLVKINF